MNTLRLLSKWATRPLARGRTLNYPQVCLDYAHARYTDISGQPGGNIPPHPNVHVCEIVVDDPTLALIQADANYAGGILWVNDGSTPPTAAQYASLVNFLSSTYGISATTAALNPASTQQQIEAALSAYAKSLPAAVGIVSPPPPPPPPIGTAAAGSPPHTIPGK